VIPNDPAARYWSVGIVLTWRARAGWGGTVKYLDAGFADDDADTGAISTEGELRTRYHVRDGETRSGLSVVVDVLLADAARLGIDFDKPDAGRLLMYESDGEDLDCPPPDGWRDLLAAEAGRIGWATYRAGEATPR
jgi:hypothetical protein